METLAHLTDVIGPRLTGSPSLKRANEWTRDQLASWGLSDAHLEAWGPFGRGWSLNRFSAQVVEPQCIPLIAYPKAWSPGLDGPITAPVIHLDIHKTADLDKYQGTLNGAIVLIGSTRDLNAWFEPPGKRLDDSALLALADAPEVRPSPRRRPNSPRPSANPAVGPGAALSLIQRRDQFLLDEGAALVIEPSARGDGGTLFVASASVPRSPSASNSTTHRPWETDAPRMLPQLVCSAEHFNRLVRMLKAGEPLKMTVDLAVTYHDGDLMGYNTLAEISGTDLKDELVMLGGHLDSWHSGTGATDNGAGVAVCMEAVRILQAAKLKPRRTIRIALWSGEEQGLLGSKAYVKEHFGSRPDPSPAEAAFDAFWGGGPDRPLQTTPSFAKISAYYNLDNGTGRIRGVYLETNEAVRPIFRRWLQPFHDQGAATLTISRTFGTDHQPFDALGIPAFQFIQDPIEYPTRTHHSNQDLYDRIQADDLKQAAVIMASFLYQTANRDELLPRKPSTPSP
jgi:hypothetical protein